jgi:hypothetical protein
MSPEAFTDGVTTVENDGGACLLSAVFVAFYIFTCGLLLSF